MFYNFAHDIHHLFKVGTPYDGLKYHGGGLNHFSWVTADATLDGEPLMDLIMRQFDQIGELPGASLCGWERMAPLIKLYGAMFLNNGHQHHFFRHDELARLMGDTQSPIQDISLLNVDLYREPRSGTALLLRIYTPTHERFD